MFLDSKIAGRGTGAKAVYAGGPDALDLTGNPVVTTQFGQVSGDDVVLDRANTTLQATGNWKLKLNAEALRKVAQRVSPAPPSPRTDSGPINP